MSGLLSDLGPYGVALLALTGTWLTARNARRAAERTAAETRKAADRKVDSEAYDRADRITQNMVNRLEKNLERVEGDLAEALRRARICDRRCGRMEIALREAGLPLPSWDDDPEHQTT